MRRARRMVLTTCRNCGAEISRETDVCPKCGVKNPAGRSQPTYATLAKGGAIIIALLLIYNLVVWLRRP